MRDLLATAVAEIGGAERPGQVAMALAVQHAMESGEHLAVQAGTGTGKSLAYLVPAIRHAIEAGITVVVSTATIALQRQLIDRDLPRLAGALAGRLGREPKFAILKGRRNYLCLLRARGDAPADPDEALFDPNSISAVGRQVKRLHEWAEETTTGDRDEVVPGVEDRAWRQLSVGAQECIGAQRCPFGTRCWAEQARLRAGQADIVVTNHALLAIDAIENFDVLPDHDVVIIDEAHELVDRVTSVATAELTVPAIETAARRCGRLVDDGLVGSLRDAAAALERAMTDVPAGRLDDLPESLAVALAAARSAASACGVQVRTSAGGEQDMDKVAAARAAATSLEEVSDAAGDMLAAFVPEPGSRPNVVWLDKQFDEAGRPAVPAARVALSPAASAGRVAARAESALAGPAPSGSAPSEATGQGAAQPGRGGSASAASEAAPHEQAELLLPELGPAPPAPSVRAASARAATLVGASPARAAPASAARSAAAGTSAGPPGPLRPPALRVAPLDVGGLLAGLFGRHTVTLTSATLSLGGSFEPLARQWGLPLSRATSLPGAPASPVPSPRGPADGGRADSGQDGAARLDLGGDDEAPTHSLDWTGLDVGSPFDHQRSGILYLARHLPQPGRDGLPEAYLTEIRELIAAAGGRTLGLFSSMRAAKQAAGALRDSLGVPLLCQGEDSTSLLVSKFAEDEATCLFGTISLWQGVDVPGRSLQLVVIDRIPFPRPDDPLASARQAAVAARGGNGFMTVAAAQAALLLAQGAGRLLRTMSDKGVVAVLDPRLATARYGGFLRASLPPFWTTSDPEVVRAALRRLAAGPTAPS